MFNFVRKAPVSRKLLMISATYSLPITIMIYLIVTGINKDITFSTLELNGNEYQRPLSQLLVSVPRYALLTRGDAKGELSAVEASVEKALETLEATDRRIGASLQFTDEGLARHNRGAARVSTLRSQWAAIKSQGLTSGDHYQQMVTNIRTMITHSGDMSNLILDPELDTYYVMDATLLALPETQQRMATMVLHAQDALKDNTLSSAEHFHVAVQAALLKDIDVQRVNSSLSTAMKEDPNFNGVSPTLRANVEPALQSYLAAARAFADINDRLAVSQKSDITADQYIAAGTKAIDESYRLLQTSLNELDVMLHERIDDYEISRAWALSLTGAALAIAAAFVVYLVRSISKPLNAVVEMLDGNAQQVAAASGQLAGSSQSLAQGASEQAASLEETSSSLKQMSAMTRKSADTAQQTRTLSAEAQIAATRGNDAMGRMSVAINQIQKSASETGKIIKVIDEIAFQTNLLALNAAVEAARAGEAGKGFAVVAEEVRNLAMRSAEAARNTASMIEQSVQSAQGGMQIVGDVGKVLEEITAASTRVNQLVTEIAAAGQEQAQGIEQINSAVSQMDKVTQSNAANAEETAAAGEELSSQAEQMTGVVEELLHLVGGAAKRLKRAARRNPSKTRRSSVSVQASKLIPLDENEDLTSERDFSEFNKAA